MLDGGIEGRPANVVFYATSNRRHLMPRDMIENERSTAISPSEATEEKVSLSDRFGLWLGFHPCDQDEYLAMIRGYCDAYGVEIDDETLRAEAIEWQATRGARSGRVAWQFFTDLAGRRGIGSDRPPAARRLRFFGPKYSGGVARIFADGGSAPYSGRHRVDAVEALAHLEMHRRRRRRAISASLSPRPTLSPFSR